MQAIAKKQKVSLDATLHFFVVLTVYHLETGFGDFCVKHDIVANTGDLPSDRHIAKNCLHDVYTSCFTAIKELLTKKSELVKDTVAVTLDVWTDSCRHVSYQCHRLIYLNEEFEMRNVVLTTSCFMTDRHIAENICKDYRATLRLFDIAGKNSTMVHDRGSNIVKACHLDRLDSKSRDFIAHGLHNLTTIDGIFQVYEVAEVVKKARLIVKAITYNGADLTKEIDFERSENFFF
ncbi:hypothetical protein QYM36_004401 [Artemia franciscana]|uniref:Uncharacterized protein n=1 Tax=Artemia franciscana TaxID=6661 RepID=A0AA88I5D4_ARTSF|nr:hypothetical protein QYM36_004401 [Artemia franciscana]